MGGIVSSPPIKPELSTYVSVLDDSTEERLRLQTKTWRVFSENLASKRHVYRLKGKRVTVGRSEFSMVQLNNKTTSGNHCELLLGNDKHKWNILDKASSGGTMVSKGSNFDKVKRGADYEVPLTCGVLFGRCFTAIVPDTIMPFMALECVYGSLLGNLWEVPDHDLGLSAGAHHKNDIICTSSGKQLPAVIFRVFRVDNWFAISDLAGNLGEDVRFSKIAIFINNKRIYKRELNFLWLGAEITIAAQEGHAAKTILKFVCKCPVARLNA